MDKEAIKVLMTEIPYFDRLDDEERDVVARHIEVKKTEAGTVLFREGTAGGAFYFIASGQIEIQKESASGNQVVIARFGKGSTLGEMAIIDANVSRSSAARVAQDAELLEMSRQGFDRIIDDYPRIGVKILLCVASSLATRLRHTSGRFADLLD